MTDTEAVPKDVMKAVKKLASSMAAHKMTGSVELKKKMKPHEDSHSDGGEEKEQAYDKLCNDLHGLLDGWDEHSQPYKDLKELLDDKQNVRHEEEDYDEEHGTEY